MLKIFLLVAATLLSGCVAYPGYYSAYPAYPAAPAYPVQQPGQGAAQAAANQQCAQAGKGVAVQMEQTTCNSQNCTTKWICQ